MFKLRAIDYRIELRYKLYGGKGYGPCDLCRPRKWVHWLQSDHSPIRLGWYYWKADKNTSFGEC